MKAAKPKPSTDRQNIDKNHWYYESDEGIEVCSASSVEGIHIDWSQLEASIARCRPQKKAKS